MRAHVHGRIAATLREEAAVIDECRLLDGVHIRPGYGQFVCHLLVPLFFSLFLACFPSAAQMSVFACVPTANGTHLAYTLQFYRAESPNANERRKNASIPRIAWNKLHISAGKLY